MDGGSILSVAGRGYDAVCEGRVADGEAGEMALWSIL